MLDLKEFTAQEMVTIRPFLDFQEFRSCDYTIGGLYMWRDYFGQAYTIESGMLIGKADYFDMGLCYSYPVGGGDMDAALKSIEKDSIERGVPLRFCCIPKAAIPRLIESFGEPVQVKEYREWEDYVYPYENFLGYHGKKLVTQRNHCNHFKRVYGQYEYKPLTEELIGEAKAFLTNNRERFIKDAPITEEDHIKSLEFLDHFGLFGLSGGLLCVDSETVGLTVGEALGDTLYIHIEKALTSYGGAYPMLASLYANQMKSDTLRYINREDDSGDEGLRRSKTEYRPCFMVTKFVVDFGLR